MRINCAIREGLVCCRSRISTWNSVALDGSTAIIGSAGYEDRDPEAAYVFELPPAAIVAGDDGPYVLDEGSALVADVNILDNDTDPEGDSLTPIVVDPRSTTPTMAVKHNQTHSPIAPATVSTSPTLQQSRSRLRQSTMRPRSA